MHSLQVCISFEIINDVQLPEQFGWFFQGKDFGNFNIHVPQILK